MTGPLSQADLARLSDDDLWRLSDTEMEATAYAAQCELRRRMTDARSAFEWFEENVVSAKRVTRRGDSSPRWEVETESLWVRRATLAEAIAAARAAMEKQP